MTPSIWRGIFYGSLVCVPFWCSVALLIVWWWQR